VGVASAALLLFGLATGRRLRIARRDFGVVFLLILFRAGCSLSLVFAYANIATGVASTIHFLYPLAVALAMTLFFRERCSRRLFTAIAVSLAGAALLSSGDIRSNGGDATFRHRRGLLFGDLLRGLHHRRCARAAPHRSNRRPSRCWSWPSAPRCSQRRAV